MSVLAFIQNRYTSIYDVCIYNHVRNVLKCFTEKEILLTLWTLSAIYKLINANVSAIKGKTVTIKIKTVKFDVKTRASSLPDYTNDAEVIFMVAKDLLCKEIKNVHPQPLQLRLMGKDFLHIPGTLNSLNKMLLP